VEFAPEWGAYYHFTYTLFDQGTQMPAYAERFTNDGMIALAQVDRLLYDRGEVVRTDDHAASAQIAPGETAELFAREGAGMIEEMALCSTDADVFRLILRIYWDGSKIPAVEAPLGEFFGGAPGYARYRCLPMSMERARYTCRFAMPYADGCRVEIVNLSDAEQNVAMRFAVNADFVPQEDTMRFHAKYHRGHFGDLHQSRFAPGGDRWPDWPLLLIHGAAGRFAGVHIHIRNTWKKPDQPAESWWYGKWDRKTIDWWWGEGDEKFFVDGEKFPSTFGTGSEDYIGYAWAAEPPFARFDSPFATMNIMPIDGNGDTCVSRFHVADNIPFQNAFEAFIEKYKDDRWDGQNECLYAVTPYWYQAAGTDDPYPGITADML
jgi:hypothetical protein